MDNGIFNVTEFEDEIKKEEQGITFSGVGSQHQNGVAERAIHTVIERARNTLIHIAFRNLDHVDANCVAFCILNHACYVWNEVPKEGFFCPHKF